MRQLHELFSGREQRVGSPGEKGEGKGMKQEQKFKRHSFVFIIAFDPSHTFARAWLVLTHHMTEYPQFNLGDISVSRKWVFLELRSRKSVHILQHIMSTDRSPLILEVMDSCRGQISVHTFTPNHRRLSFIYHSVRNQYQANFLAFH